MSDTVREVEAVGGSEPLALELGNPLVPMMNFGELVIEALRRIGVTAVAYVSTQTGDVVIADASDSGIATATAALAGLTKVAEFVPEDPEERSTAWSNVAPSHPHPWTDIIAPVAPVLTVRSLVSRSVGLAGPAWITIRQDTHRVFVHTGSAGAVGGIDIAAMVSPLAHLRLL